MQVNSISQIAMTPYSVSAFNALPEFEESKGRLEDKHDVLDSFGEIVISATVPLEIREFACKLPTRLVFLRELAELLAAHGAQDTIGLSLLHRQRVQFDRSTEVLLEKPGPRERTLELKPVNALSA